MLRHFALTGEDGDVGDVAGDGVGLGWGNIVGMGWGGAT